MTVEREDRVVVTQGNGVATEFPYEFQITDMAYVRVYLRDWTTKADTLLSTSDYNITGVGPTTTGGSVTYPLTGSPITDAYGIVIERKVPYLQNLDLVNVGGFYPESIESALDYIVFQIQQLATLEGTVIQVPVGVEAPTWLAQPGSNLVYVNENNQVVSSETTPNERTQRIAGDDALWAAINSGQVTVGDIIVVPTVSAIPAVAVAPKKIVIVWNDGGRNGQFNFNSSNLSTQVTADTQQGIYVAPDSDPTGASGAWVRQYTGLINARWFGATGDGSTDDTVALQAAVATGLGVRIPKGSYVLSAGLSLDTSAQILIGDGLRGDAGTKIYTNGSGFDAVTLNATNTAFERIFIDTLDQAVRTSGAHVRITSAGGGADIRNARFRNGYWAIIVDADATTNYITDIEIGTGGGNGIQINGGNDQFLKNILASSSGTGIGLHITRTGGVWLSDADFLRFDTGIYQETDGTNNISFLFFSQVACDTCTSFGMRIRGAGTSQVKEHHYQGCWFASTSGTGVYVTTASDTTIVEGLVFNGCRLVNNKGHGYYFGSGEHIGRMRGITVVNSIVTAGGDSANPGVFDAVRADGVYGLTVANNRFGSTLAYGSAYLRSGINIQNSCSKYVVTGNDVSVGFVTAGIIDGVNSPTGIIQGNIGGLAGTTLRTVAGYFSSDASSVVDLPGGWSVSKLGTGNYVITHNLGLSSNQKLIISPSVNTDASDSDANHDVSNSTATSARIRTRTSGVAADCNVSFVAVIRS